MVELLKLVVNNDNIITKPSHYVEGRSIEPIAVIEEYGLCHHLGCVVKYLSRAGRKTSLINDLKKAQWYLEREITQRQQGIGLCRSSLQNKPPYSIQEILDEWRLSANLSACLSYILDSCLLKGTLKEFFWITNRFHPNQELEATAHNINFLKRALGFLQSEIATQSAEDHS